MKNFLNKHPKLHALKEAILWHDYNDKKAKEFFLSWLEVILLFVVFGGGYILVIGNLPVH